MTKLVLQIESPQRTAASAKLLKKGISHPLSIVIEPGMPAYQPRYTQLRVIQSNQRFNAFLNVGWEASSNDDVLQMWLVTGPQLDGFGHMGTADEFYNYNQGSNFSIITDLTRLASGGIPSIVGRSVMIDINKQIGVDSRQAGLPFTSGDIEAAMRSWGSPLVRAALSYCTLAIPTRHLNKAPHCRREVARVSPMKRQSFWLD